MKFRTFAIVMGALAVSACASNNDDADSAGAAKAMNDTKPAREVAVATPAQPTFAPGSQEELNATIGDRVFFDTDRYNLTPEARATVGFWADWMRKHQNVAIVVEGHADERGTREYNLALGARRANSVKDYLSALGVSGARVETISYGKERPAVLGSNPAAWAKNRRSVVVVR